MERVLLELDNEYTPETRRLQTGEYADPTKNSEDRLGRVIALLRAVEQSDLASVRFLAPTELWERLEQATVFAFPAFSRRETPNAAQYVGAWFFRDRDEKQLRLFLAAEIYRFADGAYRYVVDTQQRLGTGHSMLILASPNDGEIPEGTRIPYWCDLVTVNGDQIGDADSKMAAALPGTSTEACSLGVVF